MADRPRGFHPKGEPKRVTEYTAGSAIGTGDMCVLSADGKVDAVTGASYTGAAIGVATSSTSTDGDKVSILDDPDQEFECQSDDSTLAAQTDIGRNYAVVATAATSGESNMELDGSTGATTATLPLKLLSVSPREDADGLGTANTDVIVKINNHQRAGGTGTAGTS